MLESSGARVAFINSAYSLIKTYDFDGIDLAWQFPPNKPKKIKGTFGMYMVSADFKRVTRHFVHVNITPGVINAVWVLLTRCGCY